MAARKIAAKTVKKPVAKRARTVAPAASAKKRTLKTKSTTKPVVAPAAPANAARAVMLAGLGAAERAAARLQGNAQKIYGAISRETERLSEMTADAAQALSRKAGVFVKEGRKIQTNVQATAEAKARDVAKEVKAFANKSDKSFKKNMKGTVETISASAKEGVTRLEQVFEARVAKTLNTFGVPSSQNVRQLQSRMTELQKALGQLNKRGIRA